MAIDSVTMYYENKMHKRNTISNGFTIVELLIVVVVIAILAAITAVTYRGMQDRAYNAKAVSIIDEYEKLLRMYKVDHGEYPAPTGYFGDCLGSLSDFPENSKFVDGACTSGGFYTIGGYSVGGPQLNNIRISDTLNSQLLQYSSQLPDARLPEMELIDYGPAMSDWNMRMRGVVYSNPNTMLGRFMGMGTGQGPATLHYVLKGKHQCIRGRLAYLKLHFDEVTGDFKGVVNTYDPSDPEIAATMCATILQ